LWNVFDGIDEIKFVGPFQKGIEAADDSQSLIIGDIGNRALLAGMLSAQCRPDGRYSRDIGRVAQEIKPGFLKGFAKGEEGLSIGRRGFLAVGLGHFLLVQPLKHRLFDSERTGCEWWIFHSLVPVLALIASRAL